MDKIQIRFKENLGHYSSVINTVTGAGWSYNALYYYITENEEMFVIVGRVSGAVLPPQNLTQQTFKKLNPDYRRDYFEIRKIAEDEKTPTPPKPPPLLMKTEKTTINKEKMLESIFKLADGCQELQEGILDLGVKYIGLQEKFLELAQSILDGDDDVL